MPHARSLTYGPQRRAGRAGGEEDAITRLDWIILGFAAFTGLVGFRRGLIGSVLSLTGLVAGAVIGSRVAPHFVTGHYAALVALGGGLLGALAVAAVTGVVASLLRTGLRLAPPLHALDSLGGLAAGAAWGLALAWVVAAVAVELPGHPSWQRDVHASRVIARLDRVAPPRDLLRLYRSAISSSTDVGRR